MKKFLHANRWSLLASFFIPVFLLAVVYLIIGIYPGSERSILASDAFSQFSNFHASFRNMLLGKQGFFYTWNASLGLNYLSLVSYYLGGFFTPLALFFPNRYMPDALYFLTLLKIGSAGTAFWFYARGSFRLPKYAEISLSTCYALMSFSLAHSEIIMWLDTFVYLPLIILGINRLMDKKKPSLLFIAYLMLFLTSFYMGFMVGVFSVLYFLARLFTRWKTYKKTILSYFITSLLAGLSSMVIVLPAVLDLRANGEELTKITEWKTEATGWLDLLAKNMVGAYDTTKYGSIPFIYIGLLPLTLCLFYFVCKQIPWKNKFLYGSLIVSLIASFYLVPLNLFWHGMHAPNMFLFRYAFLFSFMIITLAAWGWEKLRPQDSMKIVVIFLLLIAAFAIFWASKGKDFNYLKWPSFLFTFAFLAVYALLFTSTFFNKLSPRIFGILLLFFMSVEAVVNSGFMLNGILNDWNYPSRSLYTQPYPAIQTLVDQTKKENSAFYRLENLDAVSANDGFNYNYSSIGMFSSIRNRHSSSYLDQLGFRSRGTNLNIRYENNTLLMDSFTGIKYNLTKEKRLDKYGFTKQRTSGDYSLYKNDLALPLAFTAPTTIDKLKPLAQDNLGSQTQLYNALAEERFRYFTFLPVQQTQTKNATLSNNGNILTIKEQQGNISKDVTWQVYVPAYTQAYFSLYPADFSELESSTATVTVNGHSQKTQIGITGQYYDLGYYSTGTWVSFTVSFYGTKALSLQKPQVLALNTTAYRRATEKIQQNAVAMTVGKQSAAGTVTAPEERTLVTTIPYDKGWTAKIDGKKVPIHAFQEAFVSIHVPKGTHTLTFRYIPEGFLAGAALSVAALTLFFLYLRRRKRKNS